jgi:hypothetical protein
VYFYPARVRGAAKCILHSLYRTLLHHLHAK